MKHSVSHSTVEVAPGMIVADLSASDVVKAHGELLLEAVNAGTARTTTALHVGGLNHRSSAVYVDALDRTDLVYADGSAVVMIARARGAGVIERAATTDIGLRIFDEAFNRLRRKVRIAFIGGPSSLAELASRSTDIDHSKVEIVYTNSGFHSQESWQKVFKELNNCAPEIVVLGLGAPFEVEFVDRYRKELPPSLVMTCGGWFGFLAGIESRAPAWMIHMRLEWMYRLLQAPGRLFARYARGTVTTGALLARAFFLRIRRHLDD